MKIFLNNALRPSLYHLCERVPMAETMDMTAQLVHHMRQTKKFKFLPFSPL